MVTEWSFGRSRQSGVRQIMWQIDSKGPPLLVGSAIALRPYRVSGCEHSDLALSTAESLCGASTLCNSSKHSQLVLGDRFIQMLLGLKVHGKSEQSRPDGPVRL